MVCVVSHFERCLYLRLVIIVNGSKIRFKHFSVLGGAEFLLIWGVGGGQGKKAGRKWEWGERVMGYGGNNMKGRGKGRGGKYLS